MVYFVSHWILSLLIFFPILAGLVILVLPSSLDGRIYKNIALGASILEFIFSLHLLAYFNPELAQFQFLQSSQWFPASVGIKYIVGVDGLNLILVLLTTAFSALVMLSTYTTIKTNVKGFLTLFLLLQSAIIGVFVSLDVVLFYIFWELSLIPVYFMIGIWGGKERIYATLKFFIYGVFGSLLMLVSLIYLYCAHADANNGVYSTYILDLYNTAAALPFSTQAWLFAAVTLAFGIKAPIFPFYTWLPDVYEQAPAIYTLMSGIILKLAAYGLIRFSIGLFPAAAAYYATPLMILAVIGIIYGALIAWGQTNLRRIMAFSSLSHLGFIVLGIFALNLNGMRGALFQMINHTVTAGAFFILLNFLYERKESLRVMNNAELSSGETAQHTSFEMNFNDFGGLAKVLPWFSFFFVIIAMSAVALPGTGSFIGEWLILLGAFQANPWIGLAAVSGVILGAIYILRMTWRILFGPMTVTELPVKPSDDRLKLIPQQRRLKLVLESLRGQEVFQLIILSAAVFVLGFAANAVLEHTKPTFVHLLKGPALTTPTLIHLLKGPELTTPTPSIQNSTDQVKGH